MYVVFQAALDAMRRRANEWGALAPGPPSPPSTVSKSSWKCSRSLHGSVDRNPEKVKSVGESVSRSLHGSVDRNLFYAEPVRHHSSHGALYREPLLLALNCSFQRRNSSTRASRTLGADVATFGGRPLRSGIAEGGRTDAISYLRSIQAVVEAIEPKSAAGIKALLDDQTKAMAKAKGVSTEVAAKTIAAPPQQTLDLADSKYTWKPWRDVAPPHADVMAARLPLSMPHHRRAVRVLDLDPVPGRVRSVGRAPLLFGRRRADAVGRRPTNSPSSG
jgi:hypothetical protein